MITRVFPWLRPSRRGSAILLAVGCLAMLAILGMAYLISARSESRSATYVAAASNYDGARDRMLEHFRSRIFQATIAPLDTANADQIPVADARPLSGYWRSDGNMSYNGTITYNVHSFVRGSTSIVYFGDRSNENSVPAFVSGLTPDEYSSKPTGLNPNTPISVKITSPDMTGYDGFTDDYAGLANFGHTGGAVSGYMNFIGGARLEDTSRMINLNVAVGANNGVYTDSDADGRYWFGYRMRLPAVAADNPAQILSARDPAVIRCRPGSKNSAIYQRTICVCLIFRMKLNCGHMGTGVQVCAPA